MTFSLVFRTTVGAALACATLTAAAADTGHPALKRKFNLPPSVDLNYSIKARQSGLSLEGNARLEMAGRR